MSTEMLFDTIQASRNLDTSSEKKMWFTFSLDIIVGIESTKLSPMENLIENLKKKKNWRGKKDIHTYRGSSEFTEGLNTKYVRVEGSGSTPTEMF